MSWNAAFQTAAVCSVKVTVHLFCAKSQILTVQSPDADARWVPSGWKLTPATQSLCPSPDMIKLPPGRSHIFQVASSLAVARIDFLG